MQHQQIKAEVFQAFEKVYDSAAFSGGRFVEEFEGNFAAFCNTKYAVGVNNGTSALQLAILALGIGPGDEVIVPANTFIASAWGVSYSGSLANFDLSILYSILYQSLCCLYLAAVTAIHEVSINY